MYRGLNLFSLLLTVPASLLAITVHEVSHGYVAYKLGDPTAKNEGRLTLNPLAHLDLLGVLAMVFVGFGWAKPVPVNSYYFKNPKKGMSLVSFAGPLSNLLLALISTILFALCYKYSAAFIFGGFSELLFDWVVLFLQIMIRINVGFAIFNILPIPPLDGSKILNAFLPDKYYYTMLRYEHFAFPILMLLLFFGALTPVLNTLRGAVMNSLEKIVWLVLGIWKS